MILTKEVSSQRTLIKSIQYDDERRLLAITYKNGSGYIFHGVPFEVFYSTPSGPSVDAALRKRCIGLYQVTVVPAQSSGVPDVP